MSDLPTGVHTRAMQAMRDLKREQRGKTPSLNQIAESLGVSTSYLHVMLNAIARMGMVERRPDESSERPQMRWHLTDLGERWLKRTREFVTDDPPKKR